MDEEDLNLISQDEDWTVRYEAALRAGPALLQQLLNDSEEDVRLIATQRLDALTIENREDES